MSSPNLRDLLPSFSPSSDYFAITSGDGRSKIWDTVKGELQTEFADIGSSDASNMLSEMKSGHLSVDYTCMKWVQLERKVFCFTNPMRGFFVDAVIVCGLFVSGIDLVSAVQKKRKPGTSLLVLGTGSGDVLALDVSAGQLKWKVSDCHPGEEDELKISVQICHQGLESHE